MGTQDDVGAPDEENPEWTAEDFKRARRGAPWAHGGGDGTAFLRARIEDALTLLADAEDAPAQARLEKIIGARGHLRAALDK